MTIWVTGAKGFIGRHVAKLASTGDSTVVAGIGHGAWPEMAAAEWGVNYWLNGDVSQPNLDRLACATDRPAIIFHLAGGSSVGFSIQTPEEDFRRTVDSTCQLLEWVRNHSPSSRIIMTSSAAVYGNIHGAPIREDAQLQPFSPYGYHKRMAELICESYLRNYGLSIAVVRLFSVYGPGLCKQLLWDLCRRLKSSPSILSLAGNGYEVRDWLHVDDAASYLLRIAGAVGNDIFLNGGTGECVTVREIAEYLIETWGEKLPFHFSGESRSGDPSYLVADMSRSRSYGFIPKINWKDGVREYVSWFQSLGGYSCP